MILAISLLETPLKFRAPGVTVPVGVGIGRVAYQALNHADRARAGVVVDAGVVGG
jgi:GTP cyclohydrolase III